MKYPKLATLILCTYKLPCTSLVWASWMSLMALDFDNSVIQGLDLLKDDADGFELLEEEYWWCKGLFTDKFNAAVGVVSGSYTVVGGIFWSHSSTKLFDLQYVGELFTLGFTETTTVEWLELKVEEFSLGDNTTGLDLADLTSTVRSLFCKMVATMAFFSLSSWSSLLLLLIVIPEMIFREIKEIVNTNLDKFYYQWNFSVKLLHSILEKIPSNQFP